MTAQLPYDVKNFENKLREADFQTFKINMLPVDIRPDRSMIQRLKQHGIIRRVRIDNGCNVWRLRNV